MEWIMEELTNAIDKVKNRKATHSDDINRNILKIWQNFIQFQITSHL